MRKLVFKNTGDAFSGYYAAEAWCKENGFSVGSMCSPEPTAILKGDHTIAKWRNLTDKERKAVDGIIIAKTYRFRDGDIEVTIY